MGALGQQGYQGYGPAYPWGASPYFPGGAGGQMLGGQQNAYEQAMMRGGAKGGPQGGTGLAAAQGAMQAGDPNAQNLLRQAAGLPGGGVSSGRISDTFNAMNRVRGTLQSGQQQGQPVGGQGGQGAPMTLAPPQGGKGAPAPQAPGRYPGAQAQQSFWNQVGGGQGGPLGFNFNQAFPYVNYPMQQWGQPFGAMGFGAMPSFTGYPQGTPGFSK